MGRSVIAEKVTLNYLSDLAKSNSYNIGLILGQVKTYANYMTRI